MATVSQSIELENAANRFSRAFQAADMFAERLERGSADGERLISSRLAFSGMMLREAGESFSSAGRAQSVYGGEDGEDNEDGKDAEKELEEMEKHANELKESWEKVGGAIKKALSFLSVQNVSSFVNEVFKLNNAQMTVELNLATALNNNGQSAEAFDAIRQKASAISGATMYGDEAMIAGAAKISAYVSDPAAVMSMMDTLSDYAAGMSGGGAVDSAAMAEYAAQLGQAMSDSLGGLEESGFVPNHTFNGDGCTVVVDLVHGQVALLFRWNPAKVYVRPASALSGVRVDDGRGGVSILEGSSRVSFLFTVEGVTVRVNTFTSNRRWRMDSDYILTGISKADMMAETLIGAGAQAAVR